MSAPLDNIRLIIEDINKDVLIKLPSTIVDPQYTSYKILGRDTYDKLKNKDLSDPSNIISASSISAGGTPITITADGPTGTVLTRTATGAEFRQPHDSVTYFVDDVDPTRSIKFNIGGASSSTTNIITLPSVSSRNITLPDATDTLVGRATTDTLTNKTLTGATNTVEASQLRTTGTSVSLVTAPPVSGQIMTATNATQAGWKSLTASDRMEIATSGTGDLTLRVRPSTLQVTKNASDVLSLYVLHGKFDMYDIQVSTAGITVDVLLPSISATYAATTARPGETIMIRVRPGSQGRVRVVGSLSWLLDVSSVGVFTASQAANVWSLVSKQCELLGTANNNIYLGNPVTGYTDQGNVIIKPLQSGSTTSVFSVIIGANAGNNVASNSSVIIGNSAASGGNIGGNVVIIGNSAGLRYAGSTCVAIGDSALRNVNAASTTINAVAIGPFAGYGNLQKVGDSSVCIGESAGYPGDQGACVIIGRLACSQLAALAGATSLGSLTNLSVAAGSSSTTLGYANNTTGTRSVNVGSYSTVNGNLNCAFGSANVISTGITFVNEFGTNLTLNNSYDMAIGKAITTTVGAGFPSLIIQQNAGLVVTYGSGTCVVGYGNNLIDGSANNAVFGFSNTMNASVDIASCVVVGRLNQINSTTPGAAATDVIFGINNILAAATLTNITAIGRSNTINGATSNTTVIGDSNTVSAAATGNFITGRGCSTSTSTSAAIGVNSTAGNGGDTSAATFSCGYAATSLGAGATSVGVSSSATGASSVALGHNSRAVGSTFNVTVPQSVKFRTIETQANAHLHFCSAMTSYSTIPIVTTGLFQFGMEASVRFIPMQISVYNGGSGAGTLTMSVGINSNILAYKNSVALPISGFAGTVLQLDNTASIAAANSGDLLTVSVTGVAGGGLFAPRVTIAGMLYQTA